MSNELHRMFMLCNIVVATCMAGVCEIPPGNIAGYRTEIQNGKTNVVSFIVPDSEVGGGTRAKQVEKGTISVKDRHSMYPADLLSYLTVRLVCRSRTGYSLGTGFYYVVPHKTNPKLCVPLIVSNRHVTEGVLDTTMIFT